MLRSIHVRFILVNVLVVIVSILLTTLLAGRMTGDEFRRFTESGNAGRQGRLVSTLTDFYMLSGSWTDVQATVDQMSRVTGERIALMDSDGVIMADSGRDLVGKTFSLNRVPSFGKIMVNGVAVGGVITNPNNNPPPPLENVFYLTINRLILMSASVAGFIAIVVTLLLSRRILQPIAALTAAARRMGKGDLGVRVVVKSKDEVGELGHAFNTMADGLSRLEQLRRNMVSDVAHELRTPLTNLRGYLEAAREGVIAPDNALIESLYEEAMLLNAMTNDLQDLAMAEARQLSLVRNPINMADLVQSAVESERLQADKRGQCLHTDVAATTAKVDADATRIGQVLRNLLNNAMEFTPRGGEVRVTGRVRDQFYDVEVHDTGPGIPPEHLPLIFERFYRVDPSRTRSTGGAGLGLTIVKTLVEAHGGRVWVQSTPGAGSTFGFSLPLVPFPKSVARQASTT